MDAIEERYQFVEWLYRIRKQNGRKYGFLQPDFICIIFGKMMLTKGDRTNWDIREAVDLWCDNPVVAERIYRHISIWNTKHVTDMSELFENKENFNEKT